MYRLGVALRVGLLNWFGVRLKDSGNTETRSLSRSSEHIVDAVALEFDRLFPLHSAVIEPTSIPNTCLEVQIVFLPGLLKKKPNLVSRSSHGVGLIRKAN
jgi:hypothetical protein